MEIFFVMESFGLFDLLKSMLLFKGDPSSSNPPATPSSAHVSSPEHFSQSVSSQQKTETVNTATPTQPTYTPNAYLDFLDRHDELAKRRKRK